MKTVLLSKRLGIIFESTPTGRMSIWGFFRKVVSSTFFLSQCYFSNAFTSQIPVGTSICKVCHWMSSLSCIYPSRIPVIFSKTQSNASEFYLADTVFGVNYRFCGIKNLLNVKNAITFDCLAVFLLEVTARLIHKPVFFQQTHLILAEW